MNTSTSENAIVRALFDLLEALMHLYKSGCLSVSLGKSVHPSHIGEISKKGAKNKIT